MKASRVCVDDVEMTGASAVLSLGKAGIDVTPRGMPADDLADGQTVRFGWTEPRKTGRIDVYKRQSEKSPSLPLRAIR